MQGVQSNGSNGLSHIQPISNDTHTTSHPTRKRIPMSSLADYELYNQLGQGTFGVVTKARQRKSGKLVALKKFIVTDKKEGFPITAFREITIMKKLKNLNILQIIDMIYESNGSFFYTVSPYISSDLNGLINNPRINFTLPQIKLLMKQILNGINYIHNAGYLHRDIKTANILLDKFGIVKIADFGLARLFHGKPPITANSPPGGGLFEYTGLVVTRWYRPPELLLGDRKYTTAVDMWGIGCVFGEFFVKRPILEGKSDIHQAEIIFKLLGSPTPENFPNAHLINRHNIDLKHNYHRTLESAFGKFMTPDAIILLSGMLSLNPQRRFNALKALESPFFKTDPLPCTEKELSNLEESHESDVKRFKDEKSQIPHSTQLTQQASQNRPITQINRNLNLKHSDSSNNLNSGANSLNHSKYGVEDQSGMMNRTESTSNLPPQYNQIDPYAQNDYQRDMHPRDYPNHPRQGGWGRDERDYYHNDPRHRGNYQREEFINNDRYQNQRHYEESNFQPPVDYGNDPNYYQQESVDTEDIHSNITMESYEDAGHQHQGSYLPKHQLNHIQRHLQSSTRGKRAHQISRRSQYEFVGNYVDDRYDAARRDEMYYERQPMSASKRLKSLDPPVGKFSSLAGGKDLYGKGESSGGLSFLSKVIKQQKQNTNEQKQPSDTKE